MNKEEGYTFYPIHGDIVCFQNTIHSNSYDLVYHRHNAYEIYLLLIGNPKMYIEHMCYDLMPKDLLIMRPNEMHRCVCKNNENLREGIGINIKGELLERFSSKRTDLAMCFESRCAGQNNLVHLSEEQCNHYIMLTNNLRNHINCIAYGSDLIADSYILQILVFINKLYQSSSLDVKSIMPKIVSDTMIYIKEHITENITLDEISKKFNFNGKYISSLFKQHTGLTIRAYILDQRIILSKKFLAQGKSVLESCYMSGFSDYSNFIRSFTKSVGVSPGRYNKSNKE